MPENWVVPVLSTDAASVWPIAEPFISRALLYADGRYTPDDILTWCEARTAHLWLYGGPLDPATGYPVKVVAALVTRIVEYPQSKRLYLFSFSADDIKTLPILREIERIAKGLGCDAVEFYGRKGWQRALPDYEAVSVYMRKRL